MELPSTTVAVPPGGTARIDSYGSIAIDVNGEQKGA
jgi:hypothetical protein